MRWSLKNLIQVVAILAIALTFLTSTTVAYQVHKQSLIHSTLEANYAYVQKLTSTTDTYLREILNTLEVNAEVVLSLLDDPSSQTQMNALAERIRTETNTFDSVAVASTEGVILGASSPSRELVGEELTSIGAMQAIKEKRKIISHPYVGIEGEPIIFISVPLFENGEYKGFLGGAIYLDQPNILEKLLGNHYYENGSYVYVVDYAGKLIYHQEKERLKEDVSSNPVVQKLITGESGHKQLINTKGIPMLAGYAYVPIAEWGIVVQRQLDISVAPAKEMVLEMALKSLPLLLLSFFLVRYLSRKIALPLQKLAYYTENSVESDQKEKWKPSLTGTMKLNN